jgi:hypothetical protein
VGLIPALEARTPEGAELHTVQAAVMDSEAEMEIEAEKNSVAARKRSAAVEAVGLPVSRGKQVREDTAAEP